MIEVTDVEDNVWYSGYIVFPALGVLCGWVSLFIEARKIRQDGENKFSFEEENIIDN
jgi:hypothetical protein